MDPQAIFENFRRTVTEHYFDMNGRVGRSQFWYFVLAYAAFAIVAAILSVIIFLPVLQLYHLAMLLPSAGMGARRLQDIGHDGKLIWIVIFAAFVSQLAAVISVLSIGWLGFLVFAPSLAILFLVNMAVLAATVVLIYFWIQPGNPDTNAYGPPPPVFDPSKRVSPSP